MRASSRSSAPSGVREDHRERVLHAAGKGYPDLVRLRAGTPDGAPDAVVHPGGHEQLAALLALCAAARVAVVPFGGRHERRRRARAAARAPRGGASRSRLRGLAELLALDTGVGDGDGRRGDARARARAAARARRGSRSATTRSPTSTSRSAAAPRPARRGRPRPATERSRRWCSGLRLAAPAARDRRCRRCRRPPPGPGCAGLLVGSEGTLGVITELSLRVPPGARRAQRTRASSSRTSPRARGAARRSRRAGRAARRGAALRRGRDADVARARGQRRAEGQARARLPGRARLLRSGCLAIFGFEGDAHGQAARGANGRCGSARAHGGVAGGLLAGRGLAPRTLRGALPARRAAHARGDGRDARDGDAVVEPRAPARRGRRRDRAALEAQGTPGLVMCHVSHVYETGASLYFTFIARQREGEEIEQWRAVKRGRRATRSRRAAARSPTTTRRASTTCRGWRARSASAACEALRRAEGAARPRRDHEPGQAARRGLVQREVRPAQHDRPGFRRARVRSRG